MPLAATLLLIAPVATGGWIAPPQDTAAPPDGDATPAFSQAELDQMLASIALYPDELLSQILMAATYPLEIVEASRWAQANPKLEGDALTKALEGKTWDPSVKSLVNFPDVLKSLDENLEWTQKIGDAFLADQDAVLNSIQTLRKKAKDEGHLESNDKIKVEEKVEESAPTQEVIVIESADPQVIYVPSYDPVFVYGPWWYPAYPPPVYYYPPYHPRVGVAFGVGVACGLAWGYAWGHCDWHHHHVDIDIDRNVEFNRNIDRNRYKREVSWNGGKTNGEWKHDRNHRKGVEYRDRKTANRFGGVTAQDKAKARERYRGRADADRRQLDRDRASGRIDSTGRSRADRSRTGQGPGAARDRASRDSRSDRSSSRSRSSGRSGATTGTSRGSGARRDSNRGRTSRSGTGSRGSTRGRTTVRRGGRRG